MRRRSFSRLAFSLLEVLVVLALLVVLAAFGAGALLKAREGAGKTKCSNNLRQVGLAMIQYGDDKRFLPHVSAILALDGDNTTTDTPVSVRALVWYGYTDNPEGFICPDSDDDYFPISDAKVRDNMRLWGWSGAWGAPKDPVREKTPPWQDGGAGGDLPLVETRELSYALTRKAYNRSVVSTRLLGADRAARGLEVAGEILPGDVGNYSDGWNVLKADSTVEFVSPDSNFGDGKPAFDHMVGITKGEGYLPLSALGIPK